MENRGGDGGAGVRRRHEDPKAGMEAGVVVAPSVSHGGAGVRCRRDDPEAGMEEGVAVAPLAAPVPSHIAAAYEEIEAMYEAACVDNLMFSCNDDVVPFWEDDINEQPEVNPLFENWIELGPL